MECNELIEASAGTGKTQALAEHLIKLLRAGVKPEEIVALTFSRAAAGEIFERFVSLLADHKEATLLREVISKQHLSQIGTLDSFLMRIVRAFPLELGLEGELELLDDYEASAAVNRVSFSILRRTDRKTIKSFTDAFSLAMNHEDVRSFVESYRKFIKTWHEKVAALPDKDAWGRAERIWPGFGESPAFTKVTEKDLASAAEDLEGMVNTDAWRDFAAWVAAFRGSFAGIKGIAKKIVEIPDLFEHASVEFNFNRRAYQFAGENAAKIKTAMMCVYGYVVRSRLELARGIFSLMSAYEEAYAQKVRGEGKLVFADVPRLITALDDEKRLALEYRLDSKIRAWALDEFQDTSREQWKALSPLIEEAKQSDGEKSVFVVGDRKQAIYGWRNGDVGIFEGERDSGEYVKGELVKSWRFGPAVTEAVNRVFTGGMIKNEFPAWHSPRHESAKPDLKGFVQTIEAAGPKKEDFVEPVFNALKAVDPVHRGISAAILVRTNTLGEYLAAELKLRGLEGVVWEGESDVLDTPALAGFLDLVQLADHPGDMLTYRHFLLTPLATAKYPDGAPPPAKVSQEFAEAFTTRGLVRVFRELRALFPADPAEAWNRATEDRFTDMVRAAAAFELGRKSDSRLADFPRFLAAQRRRTLAEPGTIKVMTIHRSKGLGFDYVVLPLYEHVSLNAGADGPLSGRDWILPDPGERVARAVGGLEQACTERKDRAEQEAVCLYYVAMTRAKQALTLVLHPAPKNPTGVRFSDLVRGSIEGEIGERDWMREKELKVESRGVSVGRERERGKRVKIRRRLPSRKYQSGQSAALLFLSDQPRKKAMERGTSLHAEYEKIEWFTPAAGCEPTPVEKALMKPEGASGLWRERPFEVFINGEWTSGRFDRVIFTGRRAIIQDFKTGRRVEPEAYRAQMTSYRRALSALTGIREIDIALELLLVDKQEVVRL